MNINKTSRSFRIVMIEFVLMIGVFAIMSVIIVKMFLSADHMSKEALDYSKAVIKTENIAEHLKGSSSFEAALTTIGMEKVADEDITVYHGYYGRDWEQSKELGIFKITVRLERTDGNSGNLEKANITTAKVKNITNGQEDLDILCRLSVSKFIHN